MCKVTGESKKILCTCACDSTGSTAFKVFQDRQATANCILSQGAERRSDLCSCLLNIYSSAYMRLYLESGIEALHVSAGAGRIFDFILTFYILYTAIGNVQSESDKRSHTFIPRMGDGGLERKFSVSSV